MPELMQILSLDMLKAGMELPRVGQAVPLPSPLTCLAWGTTGIASGKSKVRATVLLHILHRVAVTPGYRCVCVYMPLGS
jgi:hypothetical protein